MQPRGYCRVALQQAKACGAGLTWHDWSDVLVAATSIGT